MFILVSVTETFLYFGVELPNFTLPENSLSIKQVLNNALEPKSVHLTLTLLGTLRSLRATLKGKISFQQDKVYEA